MPQRLFRVNRKACVWWDGGLQWAGWDGPAIRYLQSHEVLRRHVVLNETIGRISPGTFYRGSIGSEQELAFALQIGRRQEVQEITFSDVLLGFEPPDDWESVERDADGVMTEGGPAVLKRLWLPYRALLDYAVLGDERGLIDVGLLK